MAKKFSIKMICDSKSANANNSNVRFIEGGNVIPGSPARDGKAAIPATRTAKQVVSFVFDKSATADQFEAGKTYTITIE